MVRAVVALLLCVLVTRLHAGQVNLDQQGLTGSWANPATDGQGLTIEVIPGGETGILFGGWYTFDTKYTFDTNG